MGNPSDGFPPAPAASGPPFLPGSKSGSHAKRDQCKGPVTRSATRADEQPGCTRSPGHRQRLLWRVGPDCSPRSVPRATRWTSAGRSSGKGFQLPLVLRPDRPDYTRPSASCSDRIGSLSADLLTGRLTRTAERAGMASTWRNSIPLPRHHDSTISRRPTLPRNEERDRPASSLVWTQQRPPPSMIMIDDLSISFTCDKFCFYQ